MDKAKFFFLFFIFVAASVFAFDDSRKEASQTTLDANAKLYQLLPFNNKQSFDDAQRNKVAALSDRMITTQNGLPVWNPKAYGFIKLDADAPDTVNPSLWRQSQLVNISGLFKVVDRIYQVRNYDLSNMTIIEGDTGIIIVDPLISIETAKAALDLYYEHRPQKPVIAVIHSHSHVDHYGGVRGVAGEKDVQDGKIKIIAPEGFLAAAVAENVLAGNAMSRRATYMYGNLLPADPKGQVGAGLGMTTSSGTVTIYPPTDVITKTGQTMKLDGLTFEFLLAPDTEAPAEMHWYIPELKALTTAENACHTLHNTYSLRGTKIRNPLAWSTYLNDTLVKWGNDAEVLYGMHHWPVWGKEQVQGHLSKQRDMYRFINDQTLRLANQGYTMVEIAEMLQLPENLATYWSDRGYYGTMNHDVKATYVFYLGWFDGNPASLHPHPPVEASKRYVEYMGGADAILKKAQQAYDAGDYRWVAEVVNHVVFADPKNMQARFLQADALEQMGYQAESGPWRNFYLSGAQELRYGVKDLPAPLTASPDTIKAMTLDLFFNYLGMRLNGPEAADKKVALNLVFPDVDQVFFLQMENGVLNHTANLQKDDADATITIDRSTFNEIALKEISIKDAIKDGKVKISGDQGQLQVLVENLDSFDFWFNIVTP
ncbi:MAG: MBL fold metallo-hydrolase [Chlamydiales bacterium]|nr:MBL fold metallo-hydrolase [Chlamydiia bacterium]MCP5507539.1 MBL fold metallo-hydrolase [Chlamydiales bacterium]